MRSEAALAAPDLIDIETLAVLRKRWLAGSLTETRFQDAINDLRALALDRYPALPLIGRIAELRANVTAYDAAYVALAEALGCPLLTADQRLANATGPLCPILVLL
jgi:predicted nucleic acid-binding protein